MFVGPVVAVPIMLLAVYGIGGNGKSNIPVLIRLMMSMSYLRYGLEGIVESIYGFDRRDMICPDTEFFCPYKSPKFLLFVMGMDDINYFVSIFALIAFYLSFNTIAFFMIRHRLSLNSRNFLAVQYIGRLVKTHLNFSPHKY